MKTSTDATKRQAARNLFDFADILEELGMTFWLDGGTLLGAHRDGDFCDGDEDDVDIFTMAENKHLIDEIILRAERKGFYLHRRWDGDARAPGMAPEIAVKRHRLKIDLNFFERKGDKAWGLAYIGDDTGIPQVTEARFYDRLQPIRFYERQFNAPSPVEEYLDHRYGDWRTPIHRTEYRYDNPEQLRALKPDFEFWT